MLLVLNYNINIKYNYNFKNFNINWMKAHYSTGRVAASFTSTAMVPVLEHEAAIIEENELRYERIKKKGMFNVFMLL